MKRISKLSGRTPRTKRKFPKHRWNAINLRDEVSKKSLNSQLKRDRELYAASAHRKLPQGTEVPSILIYLVLIAIMFALAYSLR